jgi:stage IV sporulation protein FB
MMTDPLMWSPIDLGRWFGAQVRVHISLILFLVIELLTAVLGTPQRFAATACWLVLLLLALAVHELGHAAAAWWLGGEPDDVRLWPLGNMVGPAVASRSTDSVLVLLAGPAANLLVVVITAIGLAFVPAQFAWYPFIFENESGAPLLAGGKTAAEPFTALWFVGWFGFLNYILFLANVLIPGLPFDMGRVLRSSLAGSMVAQSKDGMVVPWTARTAAAVLALVGVARLLWGKGDGITLIILALLVEVMVRSEARMLEDGGYFEDGVFGYDFSEGYTSLEGSAAKVRPYRESALKRWRRRRSDLRRQRRQAREAAEERRMDEILAKLHQEGRSALTDEEHRFLVRVSAKYRTRPRHHD